MEPSAAAVVPWTLVTEKIPLFALTILSSIMTFLAQQKGGAMSPLDDISLLKRLGNALISYASYIVKTVFPQGLAVFYPYPAGIAAWQVLGSAALIGTMTFLAVRCRKQYPFAFVGWFWYLGTLVPVIGIVQVGMQAMADRYTYVPHIGLFIAVVWGAGDLASRQPHGRKILAALTGVVFASLTVMTWNQISHWRSSITLFEHALRVTEQNSLAHLNLGVALNRTGKGREAAEHYREALRINPNSSGGHFNLANYYVSTGQKDEALQHYREAIRINPRLRKRLQQPRCAARCRREGLSEEAIPLREGPADRTGQRRFSLQLWRGPGDRGRLPEAIGQFRDALALRPNYAEAHNDLGIVLMMEGKTGRRHLISGKRCG